MSTPTNDDDFQQRTLAAFSAMTRLVWGINQALLHELDFNGEGAPLAKALRDAQEDMITAVQCLGVDIQPFEDYKIKTAAKKTPEN